MNSLKASAFESSAPRRRSREAGLRPLRPYISLAPVIAAFVCACRGGPTSEAVTSQPVEECKQYEAALRSCFHRNVSFAHQSFVLAKSDEDRKRIKEICSDNLRRIQTACPSINSTALSTRTQ